VIRFIRAMAITAGKYTCLLRAALVCVVALYMAVASPVWANPPVTLEEARAAHEQGRVLLVDIREPEEHARGVAAGAKLLPMSQLNQRVGELPKQGSKPIYLICNTQNRSARTLEWLKKQGYSEAYFVNGGMSEWVKRGWPVVAPGSTLGANVPMPKP
jgi:rhodanese-related sulfurtransferase